MPCISSYIKLFRQSDKKIAEPQHGICGLDVKFPGCHFVDRLNIVRKMMETWVEYMRENLKAVDKPRSWPAEVGVAVYDVNPI